MAKLEPIVAEAKGALDEGEYIRFLENLDVDANIDSVLKCEIETLLRKRFNLVPHKCVFYKPTIGQWVSDLIGRFSVDDVYCVFTQASGLPLDYFKNGTIGDNFINRPFLEDLTELLEAATGKQLSRCGYLFHLPDSYSYAELAHFFATE